MGINPEYSIEFSDTDEEEEVEEEVIEEEIQEVEEEVADVLADVEEEVLEEEQEVQEEFDYEAEATAEGWKPKEDYEGNQEGWVDAKRYVERGRLLKPVKQKNDRLERELNELKQNFARELHGLKQFQANQQQGEVENALSTLETQRKEAIEAGDGDTFSRVDKQIREIERKQVAPQQKQEAQVDPYVVAETQVVANGFKEKNASWYNVDADLTTDVNSFISGRVNHELQQQFNSGGDGNNLESGKFQKILETAEKRFSPTPQSQSRRPDVQAVAATQRRGVATKQTNTFAGLPADAKESFAAQVRGGIWKDNAKDRASFAKAINSMSGGKAAYIEVE